MLVRACPVLSAAGRCSKDEGTVLQDMGVTREEADGTDIVTCWIPLVDASMDMGALRVIPGLHHDQKVSKSGGGGSDGPLLEHVKDPKCVRTTGQQLDEHT
jgi:hypothetical protein